MKINGKLVKINFFDVLDTEILEEFLSKMAQEGWMIKKIGTVFMTFEKIEPKHIKFFVDVTRKDIVDENYSPTTTYINSCKEKNLEHICFSEKFQIFTNKGGGQKLNLRDLKFKNLFKNDFSVLISILLAIVPILIGDSLFKSGFTKFISDSMFIIWIGIGGIIVLVNLIFIICKFIQYKQLIKEDNHSFNEVRSYKFKYIISKCVSVTTILFLIFSIINIVNISRTDGNNVSKNDLPLKLEDFSVEIQPTRECYKYSSSSPLAKYEQYSDSTYKEIHSQAYDEESDSYYEEYFDENQAYMSYSVFESDYDEILSKALETSLNYYDKYDDLNWNYEKYDNKEEVKIWGAKEVYINVFSKERIVVYENKIIKISAEIEFNRNNINLIKKKIL